MKQLPKDAVKSGGGMPSGLNIWGKIKWLFSAQYEEKLPKGKQRRYYKKVKECYLLVGIRFDA